MQLEETRLSNECKKFDGILSLLWHNDNLTNHVYIKKKSLFLKLLQYFEAQNAQFLSGKDTIEKLNL